jgi:hypothetical protein
MQKYYWKSKLKVPIFTIIVTKYFKNINIVQIFEIIEVEIGGFCSVVLYYKFIKHNFLKKWKCKQ